MSFFLVLISLFTLLTLSSSQTGPLESAQLTDEEIRASKFLDDIEEILRADAEKSVIAEWNYVTNITDHTEKLKLEQEKLSAALTLKYGKKAREFNGDLISNESIKRKLRILSMIGVSALSPPDFEEYTKISSTMQKLYSTAKVPDYNDPSKLLSLEPELKDIMANSRDPEKLKYYWSEWRKRSGGQMRDIYMKYIEYINKAARLNGFQNGAEMKIYSFESDGFFDEIRATWNGLKPLYEQLHAFVRHRLYLKYGKSYIDEEGPIPAHLLGNMWAQSWGNLNDIIRPYENSPDIDVTDEMKKQGWNQIRMFKSAEDFFVSIGLDPMPKEFWDKSVLAKPTDGRELVCHASAWDFHNGKDFRIKQCTSVNQEDFLTVNHEMGHIEYFLQYKNLSYFFQNGANNGFHEGVADILSLAVGTTEYFKSIGLLDNSIDENDYKTKINVLFKMATDKLAFMPFGYLVDKYRWDLYSGVADLKKELNCHWVKLRAELQGVAPPNMRYESDGYFDAGSKFHVAGGYGYIRYFTAFIYQFQFYKAMCLAAGKYVPGDPKKPLHKCNYYGSKEAGNKLKEMLKLGSSIHWRKAMKIMTGSEEMDTQAFREYFEPLERWLEEENRKNNVTVGWKIKTPLCINGGPPQPPPIIQSSAPSVNANLSSTVFCLIVFFLYRRFCRCDI